MHFHLYARSNSLTRSKLYVNGKLTYDFTYETGADGRRIHSNTHRGASKHILLFGGSFAFGTGIDEDETVAYYLQEQLKDYEVYNYGISGTNPGIALKYLLALNEEGSSISQSEGIATYILLPFHIERIIFKNRPVVFTYGWGPWYEVENDKLVYKGLQREMPGYWFLRQLEKLTLYTKLRNTIRYKYFGLTEADVRRGARIAAFIFEEFQKQYLSKYPKGTFFVYLPGIFMNMKRYQIIIEELEKKGIHYFFYKNPRFVEQPYQKDFHLLDKHPNGNGAREMAKELMMGISQFACTP